MAKDLRKVYASEFSAILRDAKANTVEAQENLQAAKDDLSGKIEHLNELKETAGNSRANFLPDAKEMLKYALGRGEMALDGLKRIAENILTFVTAKEAIPEVQQEIAEAKAVHEEADAALYTALSEQKAIEAFATAAATNETQE